MNNKESIVNYKLESILYEILKYNIEKEIIMRKSKKEE